MLAQQLLAVQEASPLKQEVWVQEGLPAASQLLQGLLSAQLQQACPLLVVPLLALLVA